MTQRDCEACGGSGHKFMLPRRCNPFLMSIETIAKTARKTVCWACQGTGRKKEKEDARNESD